MYVILKTMSVENSKQPLVREFLTQILYKSREALHQRDPFAVSSGGSCGLGENPPSLEALGPEWGRFLAGLFPPDGPTGGGRSLSPFLQSWLKDSDALDRDRNHFLKRFRQAHGLDRRRYDAPTEKVFAEGLERLKARQDALLENYAQKLLELAEAHARG